MPLQKNFKCSAPHGTNFYLPFRLLVAMCSESFRSSPSIKRHIGFKRRTHLKIWGLKDFSLVTSTASFNPILCLYIVYAENFRETIPVILFYVVFMSVHSQDFSVIYCFPTWAILRETSPYSLYSYLYKIRGRRKLLTQFDQISSRIQKVCRVTV